MKSAICIRADDTVMFPLYRHLAALAVKPGRPDRARVLCALLEVGSGIVFAPGDPLTDESVRFARSLATDMPEAPTDGKSIRVDLILPDTPAMRPLRQRLADLPGGPGAQARSRLVVRVLHAAVNRVYRDLPLPSAGQHNAAPPPASADAAPAQTPSPGPAVNLPPGMGDFLDNLSVDGLD